MQHFAQKRRAWAAGAPSKKERDAAFDSTSAVNDCEVAIKVFYPSRGSEGGKRKLVKAELALNVKGLGDADLARAAERMLEKQAACAMSERIVAEKLAAMEAREKDLAESAAGLRKIEDALAEQTKALFAEKDALVAKEKELAENEAELKRIEDALAAQTKAFFAEKDALAKREKAISESEDGLRKIENSLEEKAKILFEQKDAFSEKEKEFAVAEAELKRIEDALAEQTKALFAEKDALAEKEKALAETEAELKRIEDALAEQTKAFFAEQDAFAEKEKALEERERLLAEKEAASVEEEEPAAEEAEVEQEAPDAEEARNPFGNLRSRTFAEKRDALSDVMRARYDTVDAHIATFDPIRVVEGKKYRTYKSGRHPILKMAIRGKTLSAYLALDPKEYENTKYVFTDESESAAFEKYPMRLRLSSDRQARWTKELVDAVAEKKGIAKKANEE